MSESILIQILISIYAVINVIAFIVMLSDKLKSRKKNVQRISEGLMFFLAVAFGSIGVYVGMFAFRHKTQKWYFKAGIPLVIAQNIMTLYAIYSLFTVAL